MKLQQLFFNNLNNSQNLAQILGHPCQGRGGHLGILLLQTVGLAALGQTSLGRSVAFSGPPLPGIVPVVASL